VPPPFHGKCCDCGRNRCAAAQTLRSSKHGPAPPSQAGHAVLLQATFRLFHVSGTDCGVSVLMSRHLPMSATGQLLLSDHQRLETLFQRLLDDVHCGDWTVCQATWSAFERQLLEHLETEEKHLLPVLDREYPNETAGLEQQHQSIRHLLAELGVRIDLHALREQHVLHFIEFLKAHAAREETILYRRAKDLPRDVAKALAERCGVQQEKGADDHERHGSRLA
jgi:hemerythrin superfamily protein